MMASLSLSGRAGDTQLRGRIDAGLAEPGQLRLEWMPPVSFGRPLFILVSPAGESRDATLVLPRDKRVITDGSAEQIIQALTGIALTPDELRTMLAGCGLTVTDPASGRAYEGGWIAVDLGDTTAWLQQIQGTWRMRAVVRGPLQIRYDEFTSYYPARIHLRTSPSTSAVAADITVRLSDVDMNVPLGGEVFRVEVPGDAVPMTLEELRQAVNRNAER